MKKLEVSFILSKVDHTLLNPAATWDEIKAICDDGITYGCAGVCVPPSFVKHVNEYVKGQIAVCTVIGFPNGYNSTDVKCYEAKNAVLSGADEIDMVINIGNVKMGKYDEILYEINAVKQACRGKILKVIIETCLLTEEEKIRMCEIVSLSDADFIKTSTGFSTAGATKEDILLFSKHVTGRTLIKAAGGIATLQDAEEFISLGASRLGTSRIVKIVKNELVNSGY